MKKFIALGGFAAIATLSACAETMTEPEANAVSPFLGKTITSAKGTSLEFMSDGTVTGVFQGSEPLAGTYVADANEVCSVYTAPERLTGREYCSVPEIDGSTVVFNRRDGSQSPAYQIEG